LRIGRVVAKQVVLDQDSAGIHAEAVDPTIEPEAHDLGDRHLHVAITPVEVRLLDEEGMVVILAARFAPFPRAPAKAAQPIVRRSASLGRIGPDVPIGFRVIA
jgi:hypothetical protein